MLVYCTDELKLRNRLSQNQRIQFILILTILGNYLLNYFATRSKLVSYVIQALSQVRGRVSIFDVICCWNGLLMLVKHFLRRGSSCCYMSLKLALYVVEAFFNQFLCYLFFSISCVFSCVFLVCYLLRYLFMFHLSDELLQIGYVLSLISLYTFYFSYSWN